MVSNVEYSQMIYSMILGYLLFAELPNTLALIGAAVIVFSAVQNTDHVVICQNGLGFQDRTVRASDRRV